MIAIKQERNKSNELNYRSWGKGFPVLFIHGALCDSNSIQKFTTELVKEGYRIISPDLPGHGKSRAKTTSVKTVIDLLKKIADIENLEEYHLIGHSMGAGIASELAKQDLRVKKTALLVPPLSSKYEFKQISINFLNCAKDLRISKAEYIREAFRANYAPDKSRRAEDARIKEALRQSNFAWIAPAIWLKQIKIHKNIKQLGDRCLIIAGEYDVLSPLKCAKEYAKKIHTIPTNHSNIFPHHLGYGKNNVFVKFFSEEI